MGAQTIEQLAKAMGKSARTLKTWFKRGCPRTSVAAIRAWQAEHVLPPKGGPRKKRDPVADAKQQALQTRVNEANAKKAEADARNKTIRTDKLAGELVARADVIREAAEYFIHARTVLDTLPDAIAKEFSGEQRIRARTVAKQKVAAALRLLADWRDRRSAADGS